MSTSPIARRIEVLSQIPLFSAFNRDELEALAGRFVDVSYRRGDTVCAEGDEGDTFFVCVSGELEVWGGAPRRIVNRLGPGEFFGEMSLLLGGQRAATVTASRNARLLAVDKSVFEQFFLHNAKVLEAFSRVLSKRLAKMARGEVIAKTSTTIGVTGAPGLEGKTLVATALARLLKEFSGNEVVLVQLEGGRAPGGRSAAALSELARASVDTLQRHLEDVGLTVPVLRIGAAGDDVGEYLPAFNARLGELFRWVVLDLGDTCAATVASDASDLLVRIVDQYEPAPAVRGGPRARTLHVVNLHNATSPAVAINQCEPFVIRKDEALRGLTAAAQAAHIRDHRRSPAAPPLHRLARKILGTSVGIALGGGAAFGLAHLGVLKVLEDNDVPIDMVVGCSMGSLVAIGYAAGFTPAEMIDNARRMGTIWNTLWAVLDITLTKPALMTGDRVARLLSPLIGPVKDFDQLALPCRVVATDIETGERVAIGSGSLELAGRASSAVPMLWCPVKREGRILVDGGVSDPVPAEVVIQMGADVTIAVNAVPQLRRGVQTVLSKAYRRLKSIDPLSYLAGSRDLPNMVDLIMNSMQTLQYELGNFKAISADVRINPDLSALTWVEFYRPQEFIDRGSEAAERALAEIKRVLTERRTVPRAADDELAAGPVHRHGTAP